MYTLLINTFDFENYAFLQIIRINYYLLSISKKIYSHKGFNILIRRLIFMKHKIILATLSDYPIIRNMARFYVYELSRYCGFISKYWVIPKNGLYKYHDLKKYFKDINKKAYLIKMQDEELVGFVLLNKDATSKDIDWNIGEFFILAKFQGKGIGQKVAKDIFSKHPGKWEVLVMPENKPALPFWRKVISSITDGNYVEELKTIDYDKNQPKCYIFNFYITEELEKL